MEGCDTISMMPAGVFENYAFTSLAILKPVIHHCFLHKLGFSPHLLVRFLTFRCLAQVHTSNVHIMYALCSADAAVCSADQKAALSTKCLIQSPP